MTSDVAGAVDDAPMHQACGTCKEDRAAGRYAEALACRNCDGKGIRRTRESWRCNRCGGGLCPTTDMNHDVPHGLVEAKVEGGYSSPHLSDTRTYRFSICEACLRTLFGTFTIPPRVGEYMALSREEIGEAEPYAADAQAEKDWKAKQEDSKQRERSLVESGRCTARDRNDESGTTSDFCGEAGVMTTNYSHYRAPRCVKHGRDEYVLKSTIVHTDGTSLSFEDRTAIGRRFLQAFYAGKDIEPANEHEGAVFISTLFSLVMNYGAWQHAASELRRITRVSRTPEATAWVGHRVPLAFPPDSGNAATVANAWLTYGRAEGYLNATAHALLGYDAESLWSTDAD